MIMLLVKYCYFITLGVFGGTAYLFAVSIATSSEIPFSLFQAMLLELALFSTFSVIWLFLNGNSKE